MAQQGGSLPPAPLPQQPLPTGDVGANARIQFPPQQPQGPQGQPPPVAQPPQLPQGVPGRTRTDRAVGNISNQQKLDESRAGAGQFASSDAFKKGGQVKKKKKPGLKGFKKKAGKGKTGAAFAKATSGRKRITGPLGATPKGAVVGSPGGENQAERARRLRAQARKKAGGGSGGGASGGARPSVGGTGAGAGGAGGAGTAGTGAQGAFTGINTPGNVATGTGTLGQLLETGAPTDVQPIIDANAAAAQRNFAQLVDPSITEEFGALGLGSSSARQAATGREAGNVAARLGEEGARLGVGAQEAATGRRLQAFNPLQSAQGQTLQDITSRRSDATQRFGIETGADVTREGIAAGERTSAAGLASGERIASGGQNVALALGLLPSITSGINNPINPGNTPNSGARPLSGSLFQRGGEVSSLLRPPTSSSSSGPDFLTGILSRLSGAGAEGRGGSRSQTGQRENLTDFLSNLVFGRNFEKRQPEPTRGVGASIGRGLAGSPRARTGAPSFRPTGFRSTSGRRDIGGGGVSPREEKFNPLDFIEALGARGANIFPSGGGTQPTDFQRGALQLGGNLDDFLRQALARPDVGFAHGGSVGGGELAGPPSPGGPGAAVPAPDISRGDILGPQGSRINQAVAAGFDPTGIPLQGGAGAQLDAIAQALAPPPEQGGQEFDQGVSDPRQNEGAAEIQDLVNRFFSNPGDGSPRNLSDREARLLAKRSQRFTLAEGGEVPGPESPPDQVPILATGGEIVVPPDLVAKLGASTNPDPLIQDLQALIGKPGEGAGDSFAHGGQLGPGGSDLGGGFPTDVGNEFLQGIGGGGVPTFTNQDLDSPISDFGQGAGGTVSQLGVPTLESQLREAGESPEIIELMRQRQLANSSLSNFKAALASGTQGTNENLIPFLEQAQAEVQNIDQTIVGVREAETAKQNAAAAQLNAESFSKRADAELLRAGQTGLEKEIPAQQFQIFKDARRIILEDNPSLTGPEVDALAAAQAVNTFGDQASPILTRLMSEVEATKADEPVNLEQGFPTDPLEVERLISQGLPDEFKQETLTVAMAIMQQFVDANPNRTNEELIAAMAEQFPGMVQFLMTNTQQQVQ